MNEVQWLIPIVWPPERATRSTTFKFLVAKELRSCVVLKKEGGKLARVAFLVAKFKPSLLPKGIQ